MKRISAPLILLFSAICLFSSCLNSDDDDVTFYDDTAITAFTLGNAKRTMTTTSSSGEDSSYVSTFSASSYKFYIDQLSHEIYNTDSLPYGTDPSKILCTVTTKNSGVVVIKDTDSDTLFYYNSSDSIDFSIPRVFRVMSNANYYNYTEYTVRVNVHQEEANGFEWKAVTSNRYLAALAGMKGVEANGKIYVFGTDGTGFKGYVTNMADGYPWTELTPNVALANDAWKNVVVADGSLYILSDGHIYASTDGSNWTEKSAGNQLTALVGACKDRLYALTGSGIVCSTDNGATWNAETLDNDASLLPQSDMAFSSVALATNDSTYRLVLIGNRNTSADSTVVTWGKIEETASGSEKQSWGYYDFEGNNTYALPSMSNLQAVDYGDAIIAIGGNGTGSSTVEAFGKVYESRDGGVTWHSNTTYALPDGIGSSDSFTMLADSNNNLWLISGGNGQVWRGRLNKLGWTIK